MTKVFALEQAISKPTNSSCYFCAPLKEYKNELFEAFFFLNFSIEKMTLCNNNDQTWFSDTLTSVVDLHCFQKIKRIFKKLKG